MAKKLQSREGAIALLMVIVVTSIALIFVVSLGIMNVDYSLTSGSLLFSRDLSSAVDGCLDSAIGELQTNSAVSSLNVNDIGTADIDCQVDIASTGNKRFLRARATSTASFYNTVMKATSTVDLSTNPITIDQYQNEVDSLNNTLTYNSYVAANTTNTVTYQASAIDGGYGYVAYRDSANSSHMSVAKIDLSTMTVTTRVTNITDTDSQYISAIVHRGYLYISYIYSTDSQARILRIDLNNFAANGVSILADVPTGNVYTKWRLPLAALGDYVYLAFGNTGYSNTLTVWRIDINNFASSGITVRNQINSTTSYIRYVSLSISGNNAYVTGGTGDGGSSVIIFDVVSNFASSTVTKVQITPTLSYYDSSIVIGNYLYLAYYGSIVLNIKKFNLATNTVDGTITTALNQYFMSTVAAGNYLYVVTQDGNSQVYIHTVDLRDFQIINTTIYDTILAYGSPPSHLNISGRALYLSSLSANTYVGLMKFWIEN